jgi:hypothetical protein
MFSETSRDYEFNQDDVVTTYETLILPPPSNSLALHLQVLPEPFFVGQEIAPNVLKDLTEGGGFFSITRTREDVSLVGEAYEGMPSSLNYHGCASR